MAEEETMREYLKNDLLEIVKTMRELCDVILQECERENTSYLLELLEQGQQAAISIGETIEKLEGEGTEAVAALEEFCEHMYFLSENAGKEMVSVSKEKRILDKLILHIENGIRHLPSIYEIVFLPYKASMWDCMESIYFAAAKDPECNVSVVPIPYFDIDKNEQFGPMHYEGDMFPEQIPIISWKDFKISEHRPDIVYIHNPFDRYNLVTSVHPDYYSDQLKKYTGKLVYIPYGISRLIVPEGHLQLPTYENMDYIVIQSRKQEKYYKDKIFNGKLLPLGSPKFDRVISYQKNGVEMPVEWDKVLDGRTKFFYNTSLSALLEDTGAALKKIEYVFCCFENREDTVLIWRPHPLIESTLMSMRPQYLKWYQELVQRFCQNKIGILDKTADMSKTIALCDAYIGENASSVVDLFCALGKPIFILDMKIDRKLSEVEFCDSLFCNVEYYKGQYWTFSYQFNALCTMNMETGKLKMVDSIPGYDILQRGLVSNIYGYHDKLIFSPNSMDSIVEYNLSTKEFTFFKLPDALSWGNMANIIPYKDDFFFLPRKYPAIIQYSVRKKKYVFHRQVMEEVMKFGEDIEYADSRNCIGAGYLKDDRLYLTLMKTNALLVWHLDTCKYEIVHIGNEKNLYGAIAEVKDGFLLRLYEGANLLFWNPQTGETREINQFPDAFAYRLNPREEVHPFAGFLISSNHLLLIPQLGNQILKIDRETLEISIYEMDWKDHIREPQEGIFDNQWGCLRAVLVPDRTRGINQDFNEAYLITTADGCMLKLNLDTHQYTEVQTGFEIDDLKKLFPIEELYEKFEIPIKSREDRYHTLDDFINAMVEGRINIFNSQQIQVYSQISANLDGTCGEKVHKAVKKSLQ